MLLAGAAVLALFAMMLLELWNASQWSSARRGGSAPGADEDGCDREGCPLCNPNLLGPFASVQLERCLGTGTATAPHRLQPQPARELLGHLYKV